MCEGLVDFEHCCRIICSCHLLGNSSCQLLKSLTGEPGDSPENTHPNSPLEGEGLCVPVLRAEVRNKTGGVSIQYTIFYFVWCMTSLNPRTLSPESKPLVLPVGIEAAAQWGDVVDETWGLGI